MVILTFGVIGRAANIQGKMALCLPTEKFQIICADGKQNENGENLLLLPCFLKAGHGLLVFLMTQRKLHHMYILCYGLQ